jgi:hypothetical protein
VIEVPNWLHPERRKRGEDWAQLCPLEHVLQFTPRTLQRTMRRAGLRPRLRTVTIVSRNRVLDATRRGFAIVATATV